MVNLSRRRVFATKDEVNSLKLAVIFIEVCMYVNCYTQYSVWADQGPDHKTVVCPSTLTSRTDNFESDPESLYTVFTGSSVRIVRSKIYSYTYIVIK